MEAFLTNATEASPAFYKTFVQGTVLPHRETFAALVLGGELAVGLALVLGAATRAAALGAVFLTLNYLLAKGASFLSPSSNDALFVAGGVLLALGAAGRAFGLDYLLARRWPHSPLW
jgi:thiosulfate dehydrogenase [quinone] large subunit